MGLFDRWFGSTPEKPEKEVAAKPKRPTGISARAGQLSTQLLLPGGTPADQANLGRLLTFLEKTPAGWADVQAVLTYGVKVKFNMADGGALYQGHDNVIVLNRMKVPRLLATCFCHESTHAQQRYEGRYADPIKQSRESFAESVVRMETETYLREAIVGRELLHFERAAGIKDWQQSLNEHTLQMWFALVHGHRYETRTPGSILDADAALTPEQLSRWLDAVVPYFRTYVEPYRPVQYLKWDIARGKRPPLSAETMNDVLSTSFDNQSARERNPYRNRAPNRPGGRGHP